MLCDAHLFTHSVQMFGFIEEQIAQAYNYSQDNRLLHYLIPETLNMPANQAQLCVLYFWKNAV